MTIKTISPRTRRSTGPLIPALLALAGCSNVDPAAMREADHALTGQQGKPVASRTVMVGGSGPLFPACRAKLVTAASVPVRWAPDVQSPVKVTLPGNTKFWPCDGQSADGWVGIVFAASGQGVDACDVARQLPRPREYQGPCRWGWVDARVAPAPPATASARK